MKQLSFTAQDTCANRIQANVQAYRHIGQHLGFRALRMDGSSLKAARDINEQQMRVTRASESKAKPSLHNCIRGPLSLGSAINEGLDNPYHCEHTFKE